LADHLVIGRFCTAVLILSLVGGLHATGTGQGPGDAHFGGSSEGPIAPDRETFAPIGRPIQNLQGQRLGQVEGLLVTPDGRISAVVMATGGLLGLARDRYAIPWARVHWQYDGEYLSLDVGRKEIASEFDSL
jgi:hypothetical protein